MSESKVIKVRVCKKCEGKFETTSAGIKAHAKDC